ncbi:hypothetical protein LTR84_010791 [Exophiala bonariae]|uniref:Secreted protein n=1 Tax=Exophiala bonariae TaxID=1690606 RepID=A0AAV9NJW5_9EURO|nr:hypothetical protein LTR84_010791 [Exophiala bonariae]
MKFYVVFSLLSLLLTHVISTIPKAKTTGASEMATVAEFSSTNGGLAFIEEKTDEATAGILGGRSAALNWLTKPSAPAARKDKCDHDAPGCSKCGDCCVFRLRSKQWIEPDTNVVVMPVTNRCVPVPIEGQYSLVTNGCTNWFKNCTMWPQRDCTGVPNTRSLSIPKDINTWYGTTFYIRAISCSAA